MHQPYIEGPLALHINRLVENQFCLDWISLGLTSRSANDHNLQVNYAELLKHQQSLIQFQNPFKSQSRKTFPRKSIDYNLGADEYAINLCKNPSDKTNSRILSRHTYSLVAKAINTIKNSNQSNEKYVNAKLWRKKRKFHRKKLFTRLMNIYLGVFPVPLAARTP